MARTPKPWFRKQTGWWMVSLGGKQHKLAEGRENKKAAQKKFHELLLLVAEAPGAQDIRVASVCDAFLGWSQKYQSPETYRGYLFYVQSFCEACGFLLVKDTCPHHVLEWISKKKWGSTSQYNAVRAAQRVFNWAVKQKLIAQNPTKGMDRPRPKSRTSYVTSEEFRLLRRAAVPQFRLFLFALRQTGARPSEVRRLTWDQVREDRWVLAEHKTVGKTGKPRVIYLTPPMRRLMHILRRHTTNKHVFVNCHGRPWTTTDEKERERIVAETIMALERYFPSSWGPRLERILQYTLRTVLHAVPGATLADVEQMLTDAAYRQNVLADTSDPMLLQFWNNQFRFFPKNACDPVLNKLSPFLLQAGIRNIICQRHAAVNFDRLLNEGKILLANLSTGLLTEKVAGTLGSFLVTKIVNAAFRRAQIPESKRRPWHLYIDEFQNFMNLSVGFERILAESRKQSLGLVTANQYLGQLSQSVRQAVFGNVGTLVVFRLGVEDAYTVAKELGIFTAEDILNLEVGQAISRIGTSQTSFNLHTFREPPLPPNDPTCRVVALARQRYARPRREVEAELAHVTNATEKLALIAESGEGPSDPSEDDLVK